MCMDSGMDIIHDSGYMYETTAWEAWILWYAASVIRAVSVLMCKYIASPL